MPLTIDSILTDDLIEVIERDDEMGYFVIRLGSLQPGIIIHLGRYRSRDTTKYTASHVIHTPMQIDAYRTSIPFAESWEAALYKAVTGLTSFYRSAVGAGHTPNDSWLEES